MSRIGKKPIKIPQGVEVKIDGQKISVSGPKGELEKELPAVLSIRAQDGSILISPKENSKKNSKIWGLGRALLATMVKGVSEGFEKTLEFSGVGFKAQTRQQADGEVLELYLGFTNPVVVEAPPGVAFQVEKGLIKVMGIDKEIVGRTAALIRALRLPEPYKGRGIKYKDEVIIKKAGKKAIAAVG